MFTPTMKFILSRFHRRPDELVLGRSGRFSFSLTVRLRADQRTTHMYVIGITGQGKSKLLQHCFFQDIVAGRGCGVLDPHTDLAQDLLSYLDASRYFDDPRNRKRIIYFEPSHADSLLPFNVLATSFPPYATAMNLVEAFRRTWPESLKEAPRFTNILLASLLTLIANQLTLVELPKMLTDKDYREDLLEKVSDPEVVSVFHDRMDKWGREEPLILESVLNKLSAFTLNPTLKKILGHKQNHLDFRRIMDEGKILIVDLGRCDGETRKLLGSLIVTGIEQAALSRKDEQRRERRPFYFYIDEFQDFCANEGSVVTLAQILSEARKFGLHLTLAHQTLGQLTSERMRSALGNIGTKVVFAVDRVDAEVMARKLFQVDGEEIKHEVESETSHPVYYSLPEQWEKKIQMIQNLQPRTCLVKAPQRNVVKLQTTPIPPCNLSEERQEELQRSLMGRNIPSDAEVKGNVQQRRTREERKITYYESAENAWERKSARLAVTPATEEAASCA